MDHPTNAAIRQINPARAPQLWEALFAITHAVEQLGMEGEVDTLKNKQTGLGAWETARAELHAARLIEEPEA